MLLRQLDYFIKVVDNKSFTKAADAAFISQSAVSQQVSALEQELGVKLLKRHHRSFSLTNAGEYLYRHGPQLLAAADSLQQATINVGKSETTELTIGYPLGYYGRELRQVVARFSHLNPQLQLEVVAKDHADLLRALENEEIDLALVDCRDDLPANLAKHPLVAARRYAELAADNPLAKRASLQIGDLAKLTCIVICASQRAVEEASYLRENLGVQSEFRFATTLEAARMLVAANQGYLLVDQAGNWPTGDALTHRVGLVDENATALTQEYGLVWSDHSPAAVQEFTRLFADQLHKS